jgi:hypothetical protein
VRSCGGDVIVTIQPQSHVNGSGEKSTVVNVQGGVSSWKRRGCEAFIIAKEHPRLRHFRASDCILRLCAHSEFVTVDLDDRSKWYNWYNKKKFINNIDESDYQITDIATFSKNYDLEDSDLIDIVSRGFYDLVLVILLRTDINEELKNYNTSYVQERPLLFLNFPKVKKIQIDYDLEQELPFVIAEIITQGKEGSELVETKITSHFFHEIGIVHGKELRVALFDKKESAIKLQKL